MRFRVDPKVFDFAPDLFIGLVVARDFDGTHAEENRAVIDVGDVLAAECVAARARLDAATLDQRPSVSLWRAALNRAGIDPQRYPSSIEALLRRIVQGEDIPCIDPLVDLANAISLRHELPVGAHDIGRLSGDMQVRLSEAGDRFTPRGQTESEEVPAGEVVYADDQEVRTRRWVWRLGEKGKVTGFTRAAIFPIDGFAGSSESAESVKAATAELAALLRTQLGAHTQEFFIDAAHPEVDLEIDPSAYRDPIDRLLSRGLIEVLPTRQEMERRLRDGRPLRIYLGVDPTSPTIHLGHAVQLRKLRQFQDLGHQVILLIGDFTGRIGDPTDKSAMRVQLTKEQVQENARSYTEQAAKILDFQSPVNPVEVRFNAGWWDAMTARDMIELAAYFTVQQMLQREMFQKRLEENKPIGMHEFTYPLLQGYDSVALDVDAELGGTDQTFNMLAGRTLVKAMLNKDKYVLTGPLLEGTDGRKMSKSYGNIIGIDDEPYDMYGKVMSLRDDLILRYFEYLTDVSESELAQMAQQLQEQNVNPMDLKKRLAHEITSQFHNEEAARAAAERFAREVQRHEVPTEMPVFTLPHGGEWSIVDLLTTTNLASSKGDARRLVEQGAVQFEGQKVTDPRAKVTLSGGEVLRGRRRQYVMLAVHATS